jgi:hypothetical protein
LTWWEKVTTAVLMVRTASWSFVPIRHRERQVGQRWSTRKPQHTLKSRHYCKKFKYKAIIKTMLLSSMQ